MADKGLAKAIRRESNQAISHLYKARRHQNVQVFVQYY
jgi:hypothetical protein